MMIISLSMAEKIIEECIVMAKKINIPMVIAVIGFDGQLICLKKMDEALPISIELAPKKAYTAYALKMSTAKLANLAGPEGELYGLENSCSNIVIFGGGIPLISQGKMIGAVGVSGGNVEQDIQVAEAGVKYFNNRFTTT
ncbi:GlcG/HbpS family heme-binding protein [Iocasia frigidifontis]|nr:heme-binding protein [Iocasia fonsfrigidae]